MALDRRSFLKLGGAGIFGITLVSLLPGCEDYTVTPLGSNARTPFLTPLDEFFVQNGGEGSIPDWAMPDLNVVSWELAITEQNGIGPNAFITHRTLSYTDIEVAAQTEESTLLKTMQCVLESPLRTTRTGLIANAYWTGVPLKPFLDSVTFNKVPKRFVIYGADGFQNNITVERMNDTTLPTPILAYKMNGGVLSREHGAPVRLIVQEGFGYKNVKWITQVRAITSDASIGTYQDQGFVDDGIMRVSSRFTSLRDALSVSAGPIEIQGIAVSGLAPISKVEVSIDGGAYQEAEIIPLDEIREQEALPSTISQLIANKTYPFDAVWAPWRFRWEAAAGNHTIAVRASDTSGNVQPELDDNIYDGNTGISHITVTAS